MARLRSLRITGHISHLYDIPPEVLSSLVLKQDLDADAKDSAAADDDSDATTSPSQRSPNSSSDNIVGAQACSLCGLTFATLLDQRGHLKSDLHNYNLKQKLRGRTPVSEADFEKLIEHLDESLSGSDSEESEDDQGRQDSTLSALLKKQAKISSKRIEAEGGHPSDEETGGRPGRSKPPLLWFSSPVLPENSYFGIYRALFTGEEQQRADTVGLVRQKQLEPMSNALLKPGKDGSLPPAVYKVPHFFLCMIGGGHFAAMVVSLAPRAARLSVTMSREATVLAHKTFHRYTTRRKQGGSQSANDNAKGKAHSAGSTLRRYNEQALVDDIRAVLQEWKSLLDSSELLFIRATGTTNRRTLFGPYDGQVLRQNDPRIRGFPFSTRRATQNELMRSFIELTRLKIREISVQTEAQAKDKDKATATAAKASTPKPAKPKLTDEEETASLHTSQLQAFIRRSKLPALLSYLEKNKMAADFEFFPPEQNRHAPRPLHLAAAQNSAPLVLGILVKARADPTMTNPDGKTAFELTGDRGVRDAFRVARSELGEKAWDWDAAGVPSAMTKDEADRREQRDKAESDKKEADRRKVEEERLAAEGPQVKEQKSRNQSALGLAFRGPLQARREEDMRGLTPEMKMRLEREKRARAAEERIRKMQAGTEYR
ncbi:VMS1 -like protein [Escovopsis weberi]|uniref:VMS1-like protein n=1 Tax=Escovopsis weberi TaxID=150374 RepID=A0A0M8MZH1_ESCWE|nr:VMS1 -like protein [Escovopsis weberi]